jgi:hypothetical protein
MKLSKMVGSDVAPVDAREWGPRHYRSRSEPLSFRGLGAQRYDLIGSSDLATLVQQQSDNVITAAAHIRATIDQTSSGLRYDRASRYSREVTGISIPKLRI